MEKGFFNQDHFEFHYLTGKSGTQKPENPLPQPPPSPKQAPTPNQVPKSFSRDELPKELLKSNVIDSLVLQNEDLTARLSVTLKKMSLLEERLVKYQSQDSELQNQLDRQNDQILVLKEKNRRLEDSRQTEQQSQQTLTDKIQFLEVQSAECYRDLRTLQDKNSTLNLLLDRLSSRWSLDKHRLLRIARSLRDQLTQSQESLNAAQSQISARDRDIADARAKLAESADYIASLHQKAQLDLNDCTLQFEQRISELHERITELEGENAKALQDLAEKQSVLEENVELSNKVIFYQRKHDDLAATLKSEIASLQERIVALKGNLQTKELEANDFAEKLIAKTAEATNTKAEFELQSEQLEALRGLWKDQQRHVEKLEEQNTSLVKLNRDLSVQINSLRRQNESLQVDL